ncbi:Hydrogen cyanide synthase subunit HcnA [Pseudomonas aeruginosa]|uniref:2Fe-2S iron-sulfur cluster-binding protein n=4 Tax=Pseudomonas aeruginosa TaxID=287 RepID=UPI000DEEC7FB|nr:2Fe-2S iron-sulfur cluster-binding protein [Pseudomonas aeruginosa]RCN05502.1 Hydrogen cyanide synthase subunit HcnA [Pseudomonas aeruginosa]
MIELFIDRRPLRVAVGTSVAAALALGGDGCSRSAVGGDGCSRSAVGGGRRAPFCGMGACQECRVLIDGRRRLACQTVCQSGMRVETQA